MVIQNGWKEILKEALRAFKQAEDGWKILNWPLARHVASSINRYYVLNDAVNKISLRKKHMWDYAEQM